METYSGGTRQGANWSRTGTGGSTGSTTGGMTGTPGTTGANTGGTGQSDRPQENLTDQARDAASTMVHAARAQATSRISEQKTRAANTLGGVASALHVAGQQIRDQEGSPAAPYV